MSVEGTFSYLKGKGNTPSPLVFSVQEGSKNAGRDQLSNSPASVDLPIVSLFSFLVKIAWETHTQVVRYARSATGPTSQAYEVVRVWKTGSAVSRLPYVWINIYQPPSGTPIRILAAKSICRF